MRPLTHQEWEQHFVQLRPHVLERFPGVDRPELETIDDDFDGLIALVQRGQRLSAEEARAAVHGLDVDELGLGTGAPADEEPSGEASLDQLALGTGFHAAERDRIVDRLAQLGRRLKRFPADATYLELSVKDRETNSQVVTLETEVPGFDRIVARSQLADLRAALADVRDDTITQLEKAIGKRTEGAR